MSISFPSADFAPTLSGYTGQGAFRFWCQKVLPIVYDDSLSYYELLAKVVDYLNNAIQDVANVEGKIESLVEAYSKLEDFTNEQLKAIENSFNELQTFVDTYFDNLDVQSEINSKLDQMARNGDLNALVEPVIREIAPAILTEWMNEHITPTTPVIDSSLSIEGAAADAKATGDAIEKLESHSGYAVDEYGSVFANQNELYLHNLKYKNRPDYEFNFDDIAEERLTATGEHVYNGTSNYNHLVEYDDSMVLTVNLTEHSNPISLTIALVTVENDFVNILNITTYNFPDNVTKRLNLRRLKSWADPSIKAYLLLGCPSTDKNILRNWCKVNRNNVNNTTCYPVMHLLNDTASINSFHINSNDIPQYYANTSPKYVRGGWEYFYAYGNPIDAEFYDANGNVIQASKHGLGTYQLAELYDTCIKIPKKAYTYKIAIYGLVQFSSSSWGLGSYMMETYYKCGAYGDPKRGLANGLYLGRIISNAYKLINYQYPGRRIKMRYHFLNTNTSQSSRMSSFPYGNRTLNYSVSYYSYLTMIAKGRGYNVNTHPSGFNYFFGFACTTFISECLGINDPYQGTEWWIQNYHDKFEEVKTDTELFPGDLIISTKYRRYPHPDSNFTMNIHMALIADVMADKEDGTFGGYLVYECSNCWVKMSVATIGNLISTVTAADLATDPLTKARTWRLRMPLTSVPVFGTKYNFDIDKELDILNHPENVPERAVVGPSGDMSIISTKDRASRNGWVSMATFHYLYADKSISRIDVYKDDELLGYMTAENATELSDCNLFDFNEYVDTVGNKVYKFVPDNNEAQTCTLYAPEFPVATSPDEDGKTAIIEGVKSEIVDGKLHLYTDSFDKLYFRVIPFPVDDINGFKPRFANYINVKAEELWDGTKFDVGDKYDYIVGITGINSKYGGVSKWFRGDHDLDSSREEDEPG